MASRSVRPAHFAASILWQLSLCSLFCGSALGQTVRWNGRIVDWSAKPDPAIGDWGFDRPGYPRGLYIQGITVKSGEHVSNPVIYDNDVFDDVFDDELAFAMASLGEMNLAGVIVTPVLTDRWGFSHPDWIKTATDARERAASSGDQDGSNSPHHRGDASQLRKGRREKRFGWGAPVREAH